MSKKKKRERGRACVKKPNNTFPQITKKWKQHIDNKQNRKKP